MDDGLGATNSLSDLLQMLLDSQKNLNRHASPLMSVLRTLTQEVVENVSLFLGGYQENVYGWLRVVKLTAVMQRWTDDVKLWLASAVHGRGSEFRRRSFGRIFLLVVDFPECKPRSKHRLREGVSYVCEKLEMLESSLAPLTQEEKIWHVVFWLANAYQATVVVAGSPCKVAGVLRILQALEERKNH
ncbi:unnamed protein product [Soboliphyme baturini]|uniref:Dilute domain-containing protein n=1 Tax=Soboliphyme baturini TaxID=241478 RepID=A0A183IHL8_9BILA|nr:unnamed protein product [Soboliphyme baturini]